MAKKRIKKTLEDIKLEQGFAGFDPETGDKVVLQVDLDRRWEQYKAKKAKEEEELKKTKEEDNKQSE